MKSRFYSIIAYSLLFSTVSGGLCFELLFEIPMMHNTAYNMEMVQKKSTEMLVVLSNNNDQIDCCQNILKHKANVIVPTTERVKAFAYNSVLFFRAVSIKPQLFQERFMGRGHPNDVQRFSFIGTILKRE